jgi:hypothetical protein
MWRQNDSPGMVSVLRPAAVVAIAVLLLALMPSEVWVALTIWTLASFPIGVLFGHCVLSEK